MTRWGFRGEGDARREGEDGREEERVRKGRGRVREAERRETKICKMDASQEGWKQKRVQSKEAKMKKEREQCQEKGK